MTPEQLDLYREILGGPRGQGPRAVALSSGAGGLAGPFNAMLYAPPVGHALQELGAAIRFRTQLAPRIREMAILVVAQVWDSGYERASHEPIGREAGLTEPEIEALRSCPRWSATTRRWPCSCASSGCPRRRRAPGLRARRLLREGGLIFTVSKRGSHVVFNVSKRGSYVDQPRFPCTR
jgi:hypothetical protein